MKNIGDIIIIEDDLDDHYILEQAFTDLSIPNLRIYFHTANGALTYFQNRERPILLILSDIKMPVIDGLSLCELLKASSDPVVACAPIVFLTTSLNQHDIDKACYKQSQGLFQKPSNFTDIKNLLALITRYWMASAAPSGSYE